MAAFLLLGVIWAAVLLPPWLQSRREGRPTASMVNFRRQLWSLARTSPGYRPVYTAAFSAYEDGGDYAGGSADEVDDGDDDRAAGGLAVGIGRLSDGDELARRRSSVATGPEPSSAPYRAVRGSGSYRRRRRILAGLAVLTVGSVAPAVLLGGAWWIGPGVVGGLLLMYLALLVRRQRRLAERIQKVRHLAPIRAPRPAVVVLGAGTAR